MRWLSLLTAASHTGANGGEAAKKMLHQLEREMKGHGGSNVEREPESNTPRSQEEFERMMREQT